MIDSDVTSVLQVSRAGHFKSEDPGVGQAGSGQVLLRWAEVGKILHIRDRSCLIKSVLQLERKIMTVSINSGTTDLLVQIATYNANLQGNAGLPQDLVDWLAPTSKVSSFLSHERRAPDIVAVGFQELLPLHLGRKS